MIEFFYEGLEITKVYKKCNRTILSFFFTFSNFNEGGSSSLVISVLWALLNPKIRGSNPVIDNFFTVSNFEKTKIMKKEVGNGSFIKDLGVVDFHR